MNKKLTIQYIKTDWGNVANWYQKMVNDTDSYQNKVILPNLTRVLDMQKSQTILDIGCGVGFFCQKFYEQGAIVTGVDLGAKSIDLAIKNTSKDIKYFIKNAEKLDFIKPNSIDKITIILTIQNIKSADLCISECAKILKSSGQIVLVINHPYFRIPKSTSWMWSEKENLQYRRVDKYLSSHSVSIDMTPGNNKANQKQETISFHRPLEWYFNIFAKNNLVVENMEEWISHRKSDQGPKKTPSLEISRKEIPLFMCLVVAKK